MNTEQLKQTIGNEERAAWRKPVIERIDIKRTLGGVSGTSDGFSPSGKTA